MFKKMSKLSKRDVLGMNDCFTTPTDLIHLIEDFTGSMGQEDRTKFEVAIAQLLDPYKTEIEELKNDLLECREANASQREKIERQRSEISEVNSAWSTTLHLLEKGTK